MLSLRSPTAVAARRRAALLLASAALLTSLPAGLLLAGCDDGVVAPPPETPAANVAALIADDGNFSTLAGALEQAGLDDLLATDGPYTFFAPTDEAFYLLGTRADGVLLDGAGAALLSKILRAHIVAGRHSGDDLRALAAEGGTLTSLDGVTLPVTLADDGGLLVAGVPVEETDREAGNGVVHAASGVILQHLDTAERLQLLPYAGTFREALDRADLLGTLAGEPLTVLVAIDDGFARQPGGGAPLLNAPADLRTRVLRYHFIPGLHPLDALLAAGDVASAEGSTLDFHRDARGLPYVNDARVLASDIETTSGLSDVVEGPLYENLTIAERLWLIPQAGRVRSALDLVGLTATLDGPGPYTFFVPTDEAFTVLGPNVYNPLLSNQQGDLLPRFLRHHIATGVVLSDAFEQGASFPSLNGDPINVQLDSTNSPVLDEGYPGAYLDLRAANGVLHLMRGVLIPDVDVVDRMFLAGYTRFLDLVDLAGLEEMLRTGGPYTIVPPLNLNAFYFAPQFDCYAEGAVLSHVAEGLYPYNPLGVGFSDLAGGFIFISGGTATRSFMDIQVSAAVREVGVHATNGILHGVQSWLSVIPEHPTVCP